MTKAAWHDIPTLGQILVKQFKKVDKAEKDDISKQATKLNSLAHGAMQIVNLKNASVTNDRLDKIERLLQHIPQPVLAEALKEINARR